MANGMFVNQARQALAQQDIANAQRLVNIDPNLIPAYQASIAGARLGRAVGGLFGLEDPSIAQARQLEESMAGIDLNSPEGLRQLAMKRYQFGDMEGALNTIKIATSMQEAAAGSKEPTDIREARIRAKAVRNEMLRSGMQNPPSIEELEDRLISMEASPSGLIDYRQQLLNEYNIPPAIGGQATKQEKEIGVLTIPEYDAQLDQLYRNMQNASPQQAGVIRDQIQDIFKRKEILGNNLKDMDAYKNEAFKSINTNLETIDTIKAFIGQVEQGNTKGWPQIKRYLTKLAGDSQIGQNEVDQTTRSGDILLRLKDWASESITGTPTAETIEDVKELIKAAEGVQNRRAAQKIQEGRERFSMRNVPQSYIDQSLQFNRPVAEVSVGGTRPIPSTFVKGEIYIDDFGNEAKYNGKDEQGNDIWETP